MTRARECDNACPALCTASPITALPSIRIGSLDHVVLGFSISNACLSQCIGTEPCFNLGVSYRHPVATSSQSASSVFVCDLEDLYAGASFNATYVGGGSDTITASNVTFLECGGVPISLDVQGRGPSLGIQSHFELNWVGDEVAGYTEDRSYTLLSSPNLVHISVTNINYVAHTYDVSVTGAETPALPSTWGKLKIRYR